MTDEELAAIARAGHIMGGRGGWRLDDPHSPAIAIERLVAEVRRLRGQRLTMHVMREGIAEAYFDDKYHNLQITVRDP